MEKEQAIKLMVDIVKGLKSQLRATEAEHVLVNQALELLSVELPPVPEEIKPVAE